MNKILQQTYLSSEDLTKIIPGLKIETARRYINSAIEEMKADGCYIPQTKKKVALTKYLKRKFKF